MKHHPSMSFYAGNGSRTSEPLRPRGTMNGQIIISDSLPVVYGPSGHLCGTNQMDNELS
nr:MAG TPA: hypothetical protein [Caudoviricetes sp.]